MLLKYNQHSQILTTLYPEVEKRAFGEGMRYQGK